MDTELVVVPERRLEGRAHVEPACESVLRLCIVHPRTTIDNVPRVVDSLSA